jgi:hypothetical protein
MHLLVFHSHLVDHFVGDRQDMHHTMNNLEANTTLWFLKPQDIYLMVQGHMAGQSYNDV